MKVGSKVGRSVGRSVLVSGVLAVGALGWMSACSSAPETAVVQGSLVDESFPSTVTSIVAEGADGTRVTSTLDASSRFALTLGVTNYTMKVVGSDGTETPLAFAGGLGSYALTLPVTSGGAKVELGQIRYLAARRSTAAKLPTGSPTLPVCTGGVLSSGEPCIADVGAVTCESHGCPGMDGDEHGHHHGHHGEHEHADGDREVEDDATDTNDGDTSAALPLDIVVGPVAIPEHGVASAVQCGHHDDDGDDDEDDDDGEDHDD